MKPCSCGSSDILVTPNRSASGWGPFSYTYTCQKCGATVTAGTLDDVRRKWNRMMSKHVTAWRVRIRHPDGSVEETSIESFESLVHLLHVEYRSADMIHIAKTVNGVEQ